MTVFKDTPDDWERLDWRILQNSSIALYHENSILNESLVWFKEEGYYVAELDCATWSDTEHFHIAIKDSLRFPDYYGSNLHALEDCLKDNEVVSDDYVAIVLRGFDTVYDKDQKFLSNTGKLTP